MDTRPLWQAPERQDARRHVSRRHLRHVLSRVARVLHASLSSAVQDIFAKAFLARGGLLRAMASGRSGGGGVENADLHFNDELFDLCPAVKCLLSHVQLPLPLSLLLTLDIHLH